MNIEELFNKCVEGKEPLEERAENLAQALITTQNTFGISMLARDYTSREKQIGNKTPENSLRPDLVDVAKAIDSKKGAPPSQKISAPPTAIKNAWVKRFGYGKNINQEIEEIKKELVDIRRPFEQVTKEREDLHNKKQIEFLKSLKSRFQKQELIEFKGEELYKNLDNIEAILKLYFLKEDTKSAVSSPERKIVNKVLNEIYGKEFEQFFGKISLKATGRSVRFQLVFETGKFDEALSSYEEVKEPEAILGLTKEEIEEIKFEQKGKGNTFEENFFHAIQAKNKKIEKTGNTAPFDFIINGTKFVQVKTRHIKKLEFGKVDINKFKQNDKIKEIYLAFLLTAKNRDFHLYKLKVDSGIVKSLAILITALNNDEKVESLRKKLSIKDIKQIKENTRSSIFNILLEKEQRRKE